MEREELAGWLRLALAPGIGNSAARKLLGAFGLPEAIFRQRRAALAQVVSSAQADALLSEAPELASLLDVTWHWLTAADARQPRHVLTLADARYPTALLQIADPPLILYVAGRLPMPWPASLAMVGSRNPTAQGVANARRFAAAFVRSGWTVVSGLATGIDAAAHEGALDAATGADAVTIAVVGTGLDRVYPKQNLALAHRIADRGLVVSEYAIGTPPLAANFPKRNRIIAALSQGTVVVEAALQSGSLITARQAAEQGKEVFAIPGSIHSPQSRGCHALLKQGAKLVETAQDVLEELPTLTAPAPAAQAGCEPPLEQDPLLAALGFDPVSLDPLVARTGMPASALQARLLEFELRGEVARLPGGLFQRVALA
jgi:DNA processing protein